MGRISKVCFKYGYGGFWHGRTMSPTQKLRNQKNRRWRCPFQSAESGLSSGILELLYTEKGSVVSSFFPFLNGKIYCSYIISVLPLSRQCQREANNFFLFVCFCCSLVTRPWEATGGKLKRTLHHQESLNFQLIAINA